MECLVWSGCVNKAGYGQFRFKDPRDRAGAWFRTCTARKMAVMISRKCLDIEPKFHASYLCNNKLCVKTDHINMEESYVDNGRKSCFDRSICSGHENSLREKEPECLLDLGAESTVFFFSLLDSFPYSTLSMYIYSFHTFSALSLLPLLLKSLWQKEHE